MSERFEHRWFGAPSVMEAIRDSFKEDPRIELMVPSFDQPLRVLDGVTAISFLATEAIAAPPGVDDTKPQTITAIQGVL